MIEAEKKGDPEKRGYAVLVTIERARGLVGSAANLIRPRLRLMDKRETSKRPTQETVGTRTFSSIVFGCANRGLRMEATAPEEAAAPPARREMLD